MTYRTVCNQTTLTNKNGEIGNLGWGKRDVRRQTLETDAAGVPQPEGNGQGGTSMPDQSGYIVCGYTPPVVVVEDPD